MIEVAVVGAGGWGKNLVRNYYEIPDVNLRYVCDLNPEILERVDRQQPGVRTTSSFDDLLRDPALDAVVIATTAPTHYELSKAALLAGKDVYVEKPFVLNVDEAIELNMLADKHDRVLMVGHLLEYHPVVNRLKSMIEGGELGRRALSL